jgi:dihydrolipoamide dehydrogenase
MPSKTLLRSGALLRAASKVGGAREAITGDLDVAAVFRRRDWMTSDWTDDGGVEWLDSAGIDLVRGHAVFTGPRELTVTSTDGTVTKLTATHAIAACTGSVAMLPDIPGLRESHPWTSRDATSAESAPERLAILGGGVVGVELATAYAGFGTRVDLVARSTLLSKEEPFAGELVAEALRDLGATLHLHTGVSSVERTDDDAVRIELDNGTTIEADEVLVAVGRLPRTDDLGLENIGLTPGDWLPTDDSMRVLGHDGSPVEWLYAVGDVAHRALLTHQGKYDARIAGDAMAARAKGRTLSSEPWSTYVATADHSAIPQVTFSDPEVASVGLTAAAAEKAGHRIRVDEDRQVLLGVTFVGADVGEILHSATIAVVGEVPLARLWHAVPSFPTLSEVWLRLLEAYGRPTE